MTAAGPSGTVFQGSPQPQYASGNDCETQERNEMSESNNTRRGLVNGGGFLLGLVIGWLIFDNLALGILFGIALSAAGEGHHRATRNKDAE